MITHCPECKEKFLHESSLSYTCAKCGVLSKIPVLQKALDVNSSWAVKIIQENSFLPVKHSTGDIVAWVGDLPVNKISCGEVQNKFASLFTSPQALLNHNTFVIVDDPEILTLNDSRVVYYHIAWLPQWNKYFEGKDVVMVIGKSETKTRFLARNLSQDKAIISIGYPRDTVDETIKAATSIIAAYNEESSYSTSKKGMSLKDVVTHHHMVRSRDGVAYRANINAPIGEIVNDVIQWFQDNDGLFIWDLENNQGYIKWKERTYRAAYNDGPFKSLLRTLGGISTGNSEGRAILDGLCCCEDISIKLKPETWIKGDPYSKEITLRQGEESIVITSNHVDVKKDNALSYDVIQGGKKWFTPIKLDHSGGGLQGLFTEIVDYFTVSSVGKEILSSWLFSILMKDFASIRPGIRISGEWSSGKSTILQMAYWLFYGAEESELTAEFTNPALWRWATTEPFLPIDNKNVKGIDETLRTFLDVCATGGKRLIGVGGTSTEFKAQKTHAFVMMSGLDEFLHGDVRTRYFEMIASHEFKTKFHSMKRRESIFRLRNKIFTEIFDLIAFDILPIIDSYLTDEMCSRYRILLGTKDRTVDFFLPMLAMGEAFQRKGLIPSGDLGLRWTDYLRVNSERADLTNAEMIEWVKNFKLALEKTGLASGMNIGGESITIPCEMILSGHKIVGVKGTYEEILNSLHWVASIFRRHLPFNNVREVALAFKTDKDAMISIGWEVEIKRNSVEVKWN